MKKYIYFSVVSMVIAFTACNKEPDYDKVVAKELKSGITHDSLFLGFYFGMTADSFYNRCWELNKKGLMREGKNNLSVQYYLENDLKDRAVMNFYPALKEGKIYEMPVIVQYVGWSPWNQELSQVELLKDLENMAMRWYGGNPFFSIKDEEGRITSKVKIDGNRRVVLMPHSEAEASFIITDLKVEN